MNLSAPATDRQAALFRQAFDSAAPLDGFLSAGSVATHRSRWGRGLEQVRLAAEQTALLGGFRRRMPVLCMAAAWCGDCVRLCPSLARIAAAARGCELRFIDRDVLPELAAELRVCGAPRVPQTVWMSEDFEPVLRWGDRTLSQYRELAARTSGASCSTGLVRGSDGGMEELVRELVELFELAQLILVTSPRLRERHGD